METLDHSTITMTLGTYAHVRGTTLRAAADRMNDTLGLVDSDEEDEETEGETAPDIDG